MGLDWYLDLCLVYRCRVQVYSDPCECSSGAHSFQYLRHLFVGCTCFDSGSGDSCLELDSADFGRFECLRTQAL